MTKNTGTSLETILWPHPDYNNSSPLNHFDPWFCGSYRFGLWLTKNTKRSLAHKGITATNFSAFDKGIPEVYKDIVHYAEVDHKKNQIVIVYVK